MFPLQIVNLREITFEQQLTVVELGKHSQWFVSSCEDKAYLNVVVVNQVSNILVDGKVCAIGISIFNKPKDVLAYHGSRPIMILPWRNGSM